MKIDDQAIKALAAGAGGLQYLKLENCSGFGDSSMVCRRLLTHLKEMLLCLFL